MSFGYSSSVLNGVIWLTGSRFTLSCGGTSEFHVTGNLQDFDRTEQLKGINVSLCILVVAMMKQLLNQQYILVL
jgi:hypothetical protein